MIPTRRFWLLIALGIPLAAIAAVSNSILPALFYDAALFVALYVTFRLAPNASGLSIKRKFDPVLSVRTANKVILQVENLGDQRIVGRLRDEPPSLFKANRQEFDLDISSGAFREFSYSVTPNERGGDYFRGTFLKLLCPLGLAEKVIRLNTVQPLRVYPNVLAMREFDLLKQKGRLNQLGIRKSRVRGLGSEFESLREYADGDDFRKVDWKATARKGKLVVRQYEQERNQAVILCVDVGRRMLAEIDGITKLDLILDSVLMLAHAAAQAGDLIGLLVYADRVRRYIPPKKGRNQVAFIIEAIHDLVAEPVETDPGAAFAYLTSRLKRRSLLVCFADADDPDEAKDMISAFSPIAKRHLSLVVRISDPKLEAAKSAPLDEIGGLYERAASLMVLEERRHAGSVFQASGLHSIECEPQELAGALVSFYFVVKEKSLL